MDNPSDILLLANLVKDSEKQRRGVDYSSSDDDEASNQKSNLHPGSIGRQKKGKKSVYEKTTPALLTEADFDKDHQTLLEATRITPQYTVTYQQAVSSEDVFLQMGNRTPATSSCENTIIAVSLPNARPHELNLNINTSDMDLTSPQYKLAMPFPHPVDPAASSAKWIADTEKLILTLRLNREFDFVNY